MDEFIVFIPFIILLVLIISLEVYGKSCYVLYEYIEQIKNYGEIKSIVEYPIFSRTSFFYLFISIPSKQKKPRFYDFIQIRNEISIIIKFRRLFLLVLVLLFLFVKYFLFSIGIFN